MILQEEREQVRSSRSCSPAGHLPQRKRYRSELQQLLHNDSILSTSDDMFAVLAMMDGQITKQTQYSRCLTSSL